MSTFDLTIKEGVCQVTLHGDLTLPHLPPIRAALQEAVGKRPKEIIFDLSATKMLDSSGIGLLVSACNSMEQIGGAIRVVEVSNDIQHLLINMQLATRLGVSAAKGHEVTNG